MFFNLRGAKDLLKPYYVREYNTHELAIGMQGKKSVGEQMFP